MPCAERAPMWLDPAANIVMGGGLTRRTIGLVLPTYGINISPQLEKGAVEEAARHGLNVVCCVTDHNDRQADEPFAPAGQQQLRGRIDHGPRRLGWPGYGGAFACRARAGGVAAVQAKIRVRRAGDSVQRYQRQHPTVQHLYNQGYGASAMCAITSARSPACPIWGWRRRCEC